MGVMHFQVPGNLSADEAERLRRVYLAGDYDHSPVPTRTILNGSMLTVRRDDKDESSWLMAASDVPGIGRVFGSTSTLMEREAPYRLYVELARGKVNQVRSQAAEWKHAGLPLRPEIELGIREATHAFGSAVLEVNPVESEKLATRAMTLAYQAAEAMVTLHAEQLFAHRRETKERVDSLLACRLCEVPAVPLDGIFRHSFNTATLPMTWRDVEPVETNYNWDATDRVLEWAQEQQMNVTAGPVIDFSRHGIPDWLRAWDGDLPSIASFMCDYLETAINRYRNRIRRWVICSGSNCSLTMGLSEDDLIRLTARLAEAVWNIDPTLEVVIGLAQPWSEYKAGDYFNYSAFVFADTLLRAGLPLAGLELEWHMGVTPRGSFCRDPLESGRLLDMFSMLGCPLQVSMSYPSNDAADPLADPAIEIGGAGWYRGFSPNAQADWAGIYSSLALSKGFVKSATWDHFADKLPHRFPNAGLIDGNGSIKPALERLRNLKDGHLHSQQDTMIM